MSWLINGQTPESLGLTVAGGEWRSGAASTVRLACGADADAADIFGYDDALEITYGDDVFFQGKIRRADKSASGQREGHDYVVEDAWAELERTTYQEDWAYGASGTVLLPAVVLGVNDAGARITLAQQITEAVNFAADSGVDIQAGTVPTGGMELWPTEATGLSVAEVIRTCLRFHPDWIPWIDHTTTPPTLNVTAAGSATARSVALTAVNQVSITNRADRMPESVRLVFLSATEVDGEVYRDGTIQKYPLDGPDSGPGCLTTIIELGGGMAHLAKQQIETRDIPWPGDATRDQAKDWLKLKFPTIAGIDNTHMGITDWEVSLATDANPKPAEINTHAPRMALRADHLETDAPRELVDGAVQEWMRKRVGKLLIKLKLIPGPLATAAERVLIRQVPPTLVVVGTNAQTKLYKGRPQWQTYAEQAPAGIAQAYYTTIANGCRFEGTATLPATGATMGGWSGRVLNISGGAAAWATMRAPIHGAAWDIEEDRVAVFFGPNPDLSPQDYVDYLRLLRDRVPVWITEEERTSPLLGAEEGPSMKGDAIGPAVGPKEIILLGDDTQPPFWTEIVLEDAEDEEDPPVPKWTVTPGRVFERQRAAAAGNMLYHEPDNITTDGVPTRFAAVSGQAIYVRVTELLPEGTIDEVTIVVGADDLEAVETADTKVVFHYRLAVATEVDGEWIITPYLRGSHIYHWPEGKGLDLEIYDFTVDTFLNVIPGDYPRAVHYFRKGWYVGTDDPGTTPDETEIIAGLTLPPPP